MKTTLSAAFGMMSSLSASFTPSARLCSRPKGPCTLGPMRCCIRATTRRSNQMLNSVSSTRTTKISTALRMMTHHGSLPNPTGRRRDHRSAALRRLMAASVRAAAPSRPVRGADVESHRRTRLPPTTASVAGAHTTPSGEVGDRRPAGRPSPTSPVSVTALARPRGRAAPASPAETSATGRRAGGLEVRPRRPASGRRRSAASRWPAAARCPRPVSSVLVGRRWTRANAARAPSQAPSSCISARRLLDGPEAEVDAELVGDAGQHPQVGQRVATRAAPCRRAGPGPPS